ncbi:MAG: hypothetical protein ACTHM0_00030 [Sphingomonas sp.]
MAPSEKVNHRAPSPSGRSWTSLIIEVGSWDHLHRQQIDAALPVCHKFFAMVERPLPHDPRRLLRQAAGSDFAGLDRDKCLEALILAWKCGGEIGRKLTVMPDLFRHPTSRER